MRSSCFLTGSLIPCQPRKENKAKQNEKEKEAKEKAVRRLLVPIPLSFGHFINQLVPGHKLLLRFSLLITQLLSRHTGFSLTLILSTSAYKIN